MSNDAEIWHAINRTTDLVMSKVMKEGRGTQHAGVDTGVTWFGGGVVLPSDYMPIAVIENKDRPMGNTKDLYAQIQILKGSKLIKKDLTGLISAAEDIKSFATSTLKYYESEFKKEQKEKDEINKHGNSYRDHFLQDTF